MKFCWFVLGNGRRGYLERTIASWETNLVETPEYKIIFDDSGDARYVKWLNDTFGDRFTIVPIGNKARGQKVAIQTIFNYIKNLDVDYILEVEEDWMLNRPLKLSSIGKAIESNPDILQMRIPRVVWYAPYHVLDINAGSLLLHHMNIPGTMTSVNNNDTDSWYEWRGDFYFWSHNPNVFSKKILTEDYNAITEKDHELSFGKYLMKKYPNGSSGFWATNPYDAYITHIGIKDDNLLKGMPNHSTPVNMTDRATMDIKRTTTKVGIVIPWREQPSRLPAFEALMAWYRENLPDAEIFLANRAGDDWQPSGSRNDGVAAAEAAGCEVIVISDADTFPQLYPLLESIEAAKIDNKIHIPYTEYRMLKDQGTSDFFNGTALIDCYAQTFATACSGVNVMTPKAWWMLGGMDEKFKGWGYEDTAMQYVHKLVHGGQYIAHKGIAFSLSHKIQSREDQNYHNNKRLYEIYQTRTTAVDVLDLVRSKDMPSESALKIAVYVKDYVPLVKAGAEITLHQILIGLKKRGHQVTVFCNSPGVDVHDGISIRPMAELHNTAKRYEIILTQLDATRNALGLASSARRPLVHLAHGDGSLRLYRLNNTNTQMIISNSKWVNDSFAKLDVPKIVLYPPMDMEKYSVDNSGAEAITLVNLIDLKGGNIFWQLARVMPNRKFIAVKGGYGDQIIYPKDLPNVTVLENQEDMREVFKQSKILLMPSSYESWGRVGMEAAASGIPTIATSTPGLLESLGESGVFAEERDVASFVEAIMSLDDEATYKQHSDAARLRAKEISDAFEPQLNEVEEALINLVRNR